ncbi:OB-fold-containig protein [Mariniblastus fucicola]|nr:OB-fold-containig protein [Mariniblastus fucicola]
MIDFINETFQLVNLPATGLLLLCLLYWMMVIVGAIGVDAIDIDFDTDLNVLDVDGDFDTHTGGFSSFAELMHLNHVPVVLVASVFALLFWAASFLGNHLLNPGGNVLAGLLIGTVNVAACLFLTRLILGPFAEGFKPQENDTTRDRMIGMIGAVTTSEVTESFGQVSIKLDGPELVINARKQPDKPNLGKGDAARILSYNYENDTYMVELCKWEDK